MASPNHIIGALLQEYADLLHVSGSQGFKARAFERAARAISGHDVDVATLDLKELQQIPNVGKSTAEKVIEYFSTGRMASLENLREQVPVGTRQLMAIPGLGPTRAMMLAGTLKVTTIDELLEAIEAGKLDGMRGFGPKGVENILRGIGQLREGGGRVLINKAFAVALDFLGTISKLDGCERVEIAGSLRRMKDFIRNVDLVAASPDPAALTAAFERLPLVSEVLGPGSIRAVGGMQVDLHAVTPSSFGSAWQYWTGSASHNAALRAPDGPFATEEEVYASVGLPWIPPVLREDRGELTKPLPELVTVDDLRGDLHTHTDLTDGIAPLEKMLAAARERGYEYYAVTDHAPNLVMQRMTTEKMLKQRAQLRAISIDGMELLHGTELNIDPDGEVDWDVEFLAGFDICVASVHSLFGQPQAEMTRRLIRACQNPCVNIIGHLTTRQIGRRPRIQADFDAVFEAAAATGTAIEVNSFPDRLDLPDDLIFRAREFGVKFAIDSDAHSTVHLRNMRYGVAIAQRGWVEKDEVINTWPLARLREFVAAKRQT
ncbi:helix-hairpin-helix domain-containing protein [Allorhizocola rhizosphaerae]|uniref:helix-hairpin-helix domain-containing protein n=1 Tax=Allorhizocola rhizosphaerae TaxID=1872709 RepID=UPI000E3B6955|nr:helix-hairpin-helix domain-containing protein [Allorhizocola rhizosphaerae]